MSKRQVFRITDLSGGLNPDQNEVLIADNEATELLNLRIDKVGSLVSRNGYTRFVSGAEPDGILSVGRRSNEGPSGTYEVVVATEGGNLRVASDTADNYTTIYTGLDTSAQGDFLPVQDTLMYCNGVDPVIDYNGIGTDRLGIVAPAAAPTGVAAGTGITGTYKYVYTYYSSARLWESDPSPESADIVATNDTITLTLVAATHAFADKIRIYRTTNGGATFLLLDEISGALTTYDDTTDDADLATLAVTTNNTAPPVLEHIAYHRGYLFGSIGNVLYWSKPLNLGAWPALNFTEVPFEGNDTITALRSFQDTLIIFGRNNTLLLAGEGGNWSISRQDVDIGCTNDKAITEFMGSLVFLSYDALHVFPGFQQFAPKLSRTLEGYSATEREDASLVYVPEQRAVWLSVGSDTWAIHILNQGISKYNFYGNQFVERGKNGDSLPIWIDPTGSYLNEYGGSTDNGADIVIQWRSKVFQLSNPEFVKFVRRVGVFATRGNTAELTLEMTDRFQSQSVTLSATAAGVTNWDDFLWDTGTWSQEGFEYLIGALPAQTLIGRILQLSLDASVDSQTEIISPISVEYRESDRFLGAP